MNKQQIVKAMRDESGWNVVHDQNKILLVKEFGKKKVKAIAFSIVIDNKKLFLEHPKYEYISVVSHFRSIQRDVRLSLNKTYLTSIINTLKRAGIWKSIVNKDFLVVNDNNPKSNKGQVRKQLTSLLE